MGRKANRYDERLSARRILTYLVVVTLACGLLAALLIFTRVARHARLNAAEHEVAFLVNAAALIVPGDLEAGGLGDARADLARLLDASSLTQIDLDLRDDTERSVLHLVRGGPFVPSRVLRRAISPRRPGGMDFTLNVGFRDGGSAAPECSWAYSVTLGLAFAALLLALIALTWRFANWVFDEIQLTVAGTRAEPPSLLRSIKILELERVWQTREDLDRASRSQALYDVCTRVAHDIRSPLSALNLVLGSLNEVPEIKRSVIQHAALRINDIANALVRDAKHAESMPALAGADAVMLYALVDALVDEKRARYRERGDVEITGVLDAGYGLYALVDPVELARAVSNLIDNAVEALDGAGHVAVTLKRAEPGRVEIAVEDDGRGMPPEVLARVGERGFSRGKRASAAGMGLGVATAREMSERAGGALVISSEVGVGTRVRLLLPSAPAPRWLPGEIDLTDVDTFVSVDDDPGVHRAWADRLAALGADLSHLRFKSLAAFEAWLGSGSASRCVFAIDHVCGETRSGLDVILARGLGARSILVTGRFEGQGLMKRALAGGVRVLPKVLVRVVRMRQQTRSSVQVSY